MHTEGGELIYILTDGKKNRKKLVRFIRGAVSLYRE
jgi:hypothetical protein